MLFLIWQGLKPLFPMLSDVYGKPSSAAITFLAHARECWETVFLKGFPGIPGVCSTVIQKRSAQESGRTAQQGSEDRILQPSLFWLGK